MKFEEVLPALREGKKIYNINTSTILEKNKLDFYLLAETILTGDWEIAKEPKYRALYKYRGMLGVTWLSFSSEEEAKKHLKLRNEREDNNNEFIRLLTEVPELTEQD